MARILLYTGKGGVGKTSIAAATALLCADRGLRTIVLSTDIAHSLADAFEVPLGPEPTQIAPNLDGQEPDVYYNIARYWRTIQSYVSELFAWRGLDEVILFGPDPRSVGSRLGRPGSVGAGFRRARERFYFKRRTNRG